MDVWCEAFCCRHINFKTMFQSASDAISSRKLKNLRTRPLDSLLYLERLFCFNYQTQFALQHGGVYLVTMDTELSDVLLHIIYIKFETYCGVRYTVM